MTDQMNPHAPFDMDDHDVYAPEVRTIDEISAEASRLPNMLAGWQAGIGSARRKCAQIASSFDDPDTELPAALRDQVVGPMRDVEETAVVNANRLIAVLQDDVKALGGAAWKPDLSQDQREQLPSAMVMITETAQHASGSDMLAAVRGALLRQDRVDLAAWVIAAPRVASRRDIPVLERSVFAGEIDRARATVGDRKMVELARTVKARLAEAQDFRRSILDHVDATDEVRSGPLATYRFGQRPVNGGAPIMPPAPKITPKWLRTRAGLGSRS